MIRVPRARCRSQLANSHRLADRAESVCLSNGRIVSLLAIVVCIFFGSLLSAQEVDWQSTAADAFSITVEPNRQEAMVAQTFVVRVMVDVPEGTTIIAPPFGERLGPFDIMETSPWVDLPLNAEGDERRRWITQLKLESLHSGFLQIPPIEISCRLKGKTRILTSTPVRIEIKSVLDEQEQPTEIRELKDVVDVDLPQPRNNGAQLIAGIVGLAIAIALGFFIWAKRRPMSPAKWAETQISQLALHGSAESPASHYGRLSQILREYLEATTGIAATRQTSEELIAELSSHPQLDPQVSERLEKFFRDADRTRYVGDQGEQSTSDAVGRVRLLIEEINKTSTRREVG